MYLLNKSKKILQEDGFLLLGIHIKNYIKNKFRCKLYNKIYKLNNASFGLAPSLINVKKANIGSDFYAGNFLRFELITRHLDIDYSPACSIGNNVRISDYGHIGCCYNISIGNNVLIGSKVFITDHDHGSYSGENHTKSNIAPNQRLLSFGKVTVGNNVYIGEGVVILKNVIIENGAIIAANSVLTSGTVVPTDTIYGGIPAKFIKDLRKSN